MFRCGTFTAEWQCTERCPARSPPSGSVKYTATRSRAYRPHCHSALSVPMRYARCHLAVRNALPLAPERAAQHVHHRVAVRTAPLRDLRQEDRPLRNLPALFPTPDERSLHRTRGFDRPVQPVGGGGRRERAQRPALSRPDPSRAPFAARVRAAGGAPYPRACMLTHGQGSWPNLVEGFFSKMTRQAPRSDPGLEQGRARGEDPALPRGGGRRAMRGRDPSDMGPTAKGPVVDTLLSDGANKAS